MPAASRWAGVSSAALSRRELAEHRRGVGFVFQRFNLLPALTVIDNVAAPVLPYRVPFDKHARARELLAAVGLEERATSLPSRLSGGQQQRVAIARALINRPPIVLADEPTGNLDSATGAEIVDLLLRLRADHGMTILLATHDSAVAARCDRVVRLKDGRVADDVDVARAADPEATLGGSAAPARADAMGRVVLGELLHRRSRTLALLAGILVATAAFTVLTGTSRTQRLEARGTVAKSFRGDYDVLVRPRGSRDEAERASGQVQPNFLSGTFGGISVAQWRGIQRTPGVEIAAPIANIGYLLPTATVAVDVSQAAGARGRALLRARIAWRSDRGLTRVRDAADYVYVTPHRLRKEPLDERVNGPYGAIVPARGHTRPQAADPGLLQRHRDAVPRPLRPVATDPAHPARLLLARRHGAHGGLCAAAAGEAAARAALVVPLAAHARSTPTPRRG